MSGVTCLFPSILPLPFGQLKPQLQREEVPKMTNTHAQTPQYHHKCLQTNQMNPIDQALGINSNKLVLLACTTNSNIIPCRTAKPQQRASQHRLSTTSSCNKAISNININMIMLYYVLENNSIEIQFHTHITYYIPSHSDSKPSFVSWTEVL